MEYPNYTDDSRMLSVDFEVLGLVHGVFFRKYVLQAANKLGVTGWVKKTPTGSVAGTIQGNKAGVALMKDWLYKEGSPRCLIQGCVFRNEHELINLDFPQFTISPSDW
ncbi:acylphosphatase-1-like [Mya arenaria]|uniref:acylphosphatase-1-like n=1 Tax=Mya arenaria TaxID=6604 RepID=UPI0022E687DB|nr:acylphosphatase-1-like [Mya arenaria]